MRRGITAAGIVCLAACQEPPAAVDVADARPQRPDARVPAPDAPVDAGAPDAGTPDAPGCGAPQAGPNPTGIRLTDVTFDLPDVYLAAQASSDPWSFGAGVALVDIEPDGDLDVILARPDIADPARPGGPAALLRNEGPNEVLADFVYDEAFAALTAGHEIHGVAAGDVDADGDIDLFLAAKGFDVFLRNDGPAGFVDVTEDAGVAGPIADMTSGGVFADVNRDGMLDLFAFAQTPVWPPRSDWRMGNRLYLNRGDGTFRDASAAMGQEAIGRGSTHAALISDLDDDGLLEIYVVNDQFSADGEGGELTLDGDQYLDPRDFDTFGRPSYFDRGEPYGLEPPRSAMGAALADLDFDGDDDLYVTDLGSKHVQLWDPLLPGYVGDDEDAYGLKLTGNGTPDYLYISWGARFMDLDLDGWQELFLVNGAFTYVGLCDEGYQRDLFLRSEGPGHFEPMTAEVGLPGEDLCPAPAAQPQSGRGVVVGDLDGDGDDDVVLSPYAEQYRFYRNDTPSCPGWRLRVRPRGTVSSPDPVGAVMTVELADGRTLRRTLYGGGDVYSQSDRVLDVGLRGTTVVSAELRWPSGFVQRLDRMPGFMLDREMVVAEPEWIQLGARMVPFPGQTEIVYTPVDEIGLTVGPSAAGRSVVMTRSDGEPILVVDRLDGSYAATLVHNGYPRPIVITIVDNGVELQPHPIIELL